MRYPLNLSCGRSQVIYHSAVPCDLQPEITLDGVPTERPLRIKAGGKVEAGE
jgi:hypothetical protein